MPQISILIPSLRQELVDARIREFELTNPHADYELVIVSPFPVYGRKVIHIPEVRKDGVIAAMDLAYKHSSGDYIVYWSDDSCPTANCLGNMVDFLKQFREPVIGAFRLKKDGRELPQWSVYNKHYACWGCASRNTFAKIGGFFDTSFKSYWADPDMSMRTWASNGAVKLCPDAWVELLHVHDEVRSSNWGKYFETDTVTFMNRWHPTYGVGWSNKWDEFNLEVPLSDQIYQSSRPKSNAGTACDNMINILHIPLEFNEWERARHWSYSAQLGLEEGFRPNLISALTVPAVCRLSAFELQTPQTTNWLKHLKELCSDHVFDQVWVELVHTNLDEEALEFISHLAPVRVGFIPESLEYDQETCTISPFLKGRKALVYERLPYFTHILAVDEYDAEKLNQEGMVKAMWWPISVPSRFIDYPPPVDAKMPAFFTGAAYGNRKQWLSMPQLSKLLEKAVSAENRTDLPQKFDDLNAAVNRYTENGRIFNDYVVGVYTDALRSIRANCFRLWLQTLQQGSAIVNLPSFFQGYASRVVEGMAAGRPVISWEVPDRPRTKALFEDGKEILLFGKDSAEDLIDRITRLQEDPELCLQLASNARTKILKFHTAEKRVRQIQNWITQDIEPVYQDETRHLTVDLPVAKFFALTGQNYD